MRTTREHAPLLVYTSVSLCGTSAGLLLLLLLLLSSCERERIVDAGPDTTPPLPPAGVVVEGARDGYIFIGWIRNRESDLRGYIVYRAEHIPPGIFIAVDTLTQNFIIDGQRSYDTTYHYFITALDASGNESIAIDTVSATSPNLSAPDAPLRFSSNGANDGTTQAMHLSWEPVEEADLSTYRIYRSDTPFDTPDPARRVTETEQIFFIDTAGMRIGMLMYYGITAVDRGGRESKLSPVLSDLIAHRPILLTPPDNGTTRVFPTLSWLRVPEASRYLVSISLAEQTGEVWSGYVPNTAADTVQIRYTGTALTPGTRYFWRVSSVTADNGKPNGISAARRFIVKD
ncbi:MAG: hypothetical protein JXA28_07460 [Bacteroidetes bacterium]|nr:hypothetical protein [Bacteroidota bacterium]